jgi:benzoyl-CoA reductase/2-hydroxyglutaryl-CoA dehydratase subunit BcrC/BadD/HgdB
MEKLAAHLQSRPAELKRLKDKGVKVVGYFPGDYVPEEMIYAAGAAPVCLCHGGDPRPVGIALSATTRFLCPFARALFGERLLGEQPFYNLVDMLVAPITCQHLRRAADMWQHHLGIAVFHLGVPLEYDSDYGLKYYRDRLEDLRRSLEGFTETAISDENLGRAIELYNTLRGLLRRISLLRKASPPTLSTLDFIRLNHASFYADPVFMIDLLFSLASELEQRVGGERGDGSSPRLLVTGPNIAFGDYKVLEIAQELGAQIVAEEFFEGLRYYWGDVEPEGSPLEALARRYLVERVPSGVMPGAAPKRYNFITRLAQEFDVKGILWYQLLFCETYDIESYFFTQKVKEAGMPVLKLQSDYDVLDRGSIKTRMEAFIETVKGGAGQ